MKFSRTHEPAIGDFAPHYDHFSSMFVKVHANQPKSIRATLGKGSIITLFAKEMEPPVDEINSAFDRVERPKELTLHVAVEHDNYDHSNDVMHRAKDYDGRWQDVPDEHLLRCHWGLAHLGADGLQFYLPAAMIWVLSNFRDTNELIVDWTIYQLAPNRENTRLSEHYASRFQLFTSAQWLACRSFLEFLLFEDPEGDIIDSLVAKQALAEVEAKIRGEQFAAGNRP